MSYKRKGQLTPSPDWNKHLGRYLHRVFWRKERNAEKALIMDELTTIESEKHDGLYVVSVYDGFDREWFNICEPTTYDEAKKLYNLKTNNDTINNNFRYIDYYGIFKA